MLTMTKSSYFALPANTRRKHKNGTYWLKVSNKYGKGTQIKWVQVNWTH